MILTLLVNEYIVRFKIPVHITKGVQFRDCIKEYPEDIDDK
jgi:hypothetical protein